MLTYSLLTFNSTRAAFALYTLERAVVIDCDATSPLLDFAAFHRREPWLKPLSSVQVLDLSAEGKEEVFYGPTLPFASNGIATCFLPAPYFTCPNLQTLQVPHHRIGAV